MRKTDVDQLFHVQVAMIITRLGDGAREQNAGRVDCLPDVSTVHAAGDFFNQNRRETLGTQPEKVL